MKIRILLLIAIMVIIATQTTTYAEANFSASSLTASDVNCKECHIGTPHIIHAQKPAATCENCHGDKRSVTIPQCTNCHNGTIHKVHKGKVNTQTCDYCHKSINQVHINLTNNAVCSHCHEDLVEVHGDNESCVKCHKTPPDIVKPLKSEGMILVCQNCHPSTSVATIHGDIDSKQGCYNCHKGTSELNGSDVPHTIHVDKTGCQDCHQDNGKIVIPRCDKCHKINELHAFDKIGTRITDQRCQICHPDITKTPQEANVQGVMTNGAIPGGDVTNADIIPENTATSGETQGLPKVPGFDIISGIVVLYAVMIKSRK